MAGYLDGESIPELDDNGRPLEPWLDEILQQDEEAIETEADPTFDGAVAHLAAVGCTQAQIADELGVSERTVQSSYARLRARFQ